MFGNADTPILTAHTGGDEFSLTETRNRLGWTYDTFNSSLARQGRQGRAG